MFFKSSQQPRKEAQRHPFLAKADKPWGQFGLKCHKFNSQAKTPVCPRGELLPFITHQHTKSSRRPIYNSKNMMNKLSSQIARDLHSEEMIDLMYDYVKMISFK